MTIVKSVLNALPLDLQNAIRAFYREISSARIIAQWEENGRPVPPPHVVKQLVIKEFQEKTQYNVLVETGTYRGDMVHAQRNNFRHIYSVELSFELWTNAYRRFRKYPYIEILHGDSGKVLDKITTRLCEPAIFWLDGHYSGGVTAIGDKQCPIYGEIDAIFKGKRFKHVILVDDARCFTGDCDYPSVEELTKYVESKDPSYSATIKDDVLRFIPRELPVV